MDAVTGRIPLVALTLCALAASATAQTQRPVHAHPHPAPSAKAATPAVVPAATPAAESIASIAISSMAWLPPEATVQAVLQQLPAVREAEAGMAVAKARAQRWRAGPHEWNLKLGVDRRADHGNGSAYVEPDIGIERALRWPGKASADENLAQQALRVGQLAHADAWHEAARALLADWGDAVREARSAQVWAAQATLARQQLDTVAKRVQAGDAAQMELLAAQAEHARAAAAAAQAQSRAQVRSRALSLRYPTALAALPLRAEALPQPLQPSVTVEQAAAQILDDNHEIELAEAQAQLARAHAERVQQDRLADPTLGLHAKRERGGQERVMGLTVAWPFGGVARQADAAVALAEAQQAEQRHAATVRKVQAEAWQTAQALHETHANWRQMEAARLATLRSADLQARARSLGEAPLGDVLQARRLAQEATLAAEMARVDVLLAHAKWQLDSHRLWTQAEH